MTHSSVCRFLLPGLLSPVPGSCPVAIKSSSDRLLLYQQLFRSVVTLYPVLALLGSDLAPKPSNLAPLRFSVGLDLLKPFLAHGASLLQKLTWLEQPDCKIHMPWRSQIVKLGDSISDSS
jgi:hypothetical protein